MAMFPPSIPHVFVKWLTEPLDLVADPFSGRGTAPFEAGLLGRRSFGGDANPLAYVLTAAKLQPPQMCELLDRLDELGKRQTVRNICNVSEPIRTVFHPRTLGELLWLREELDLARPTDRFLIASLLGVLHLNATSTGEPRGLSVAMPNTFAMAPNYVCSYVRSHALKPPDISALKLLVGRLQRFAPQGPDFLPGTAIKADVHDSCAILARDPAKLIFTSPPYLEVIRYGKFNWLRLWLLGADPRCVDANLFHSSSLSSYLNFMSGVLQSLRSAVRDDGYVCLVIGDVRRGQVNINLANEVADHCLDATDLRLVGIVTDRFPAQRKVSRIWGDTRGRATKVERVLVLAGPKASTSRPLARIKWG